MNTSVAAATLLAALNKLTGQKVSPAALFDQTLLLEQRLSTGGGWQDQVGGVVGGIKSTVTAPGLQHPAIVQGAPYDLIVANILAGPLVAIAPSIGRAAGHGATIILSGLLRTQAARIVTAYAQQGIVLVRRLERGDWATLILEKP